MSDRINSTDEQYAVTTSTNQVAACARSVFIISKAKQDGAPDDMVRYGQEIRLASNTYLNKRSMYLHSCPISPMAFARFSRNQEVSLHTKANGSTVWRILSAQGPAQHRLGEVVLQGDDFVLEHCGTCNCLSNEKIAYRNDFGNEWEVSAKTSCTKAKTQLLAGEYNGERTLETTNKGINKNNYWSFVLASDPAAATVPTPAPKYDPTTLIQDLKEALKARGSMTIRGLARVFKIVDDNGNKQLERQEVLNGFSQFGVHLSDEHYDTLLAHFDKDKSGTLNYDEFLRAMRGDLNVSRLGWIRKAYDKLDVTGDGKVTLEDVARLYDVSHHPDVVEGKKTEEEAYKEFMSLWDTQVADGIVTFDEFCDYYRDISASIDTDEYFGVVL